jgi:cytochrome c5
MHTRRFVSLMVATMFILVGTALAGGLDGKSLYRDNCRVCHDKGSPHKQYTPMTLTQAQWRSFFSAKLVSSHKSAVHPKTGKHLLESLSPEQMKAIQRFAIDHAADSEQPATCG